MRFSLSLGRLGLSSASITASTGANWVDPAYDAAGNMICAPRPGDEGTAAKALLCDEGLAGGYTTVKDTVRELWRQATREVFMPLTQRPGEALRGRPQE